MAAMKVTQGGKNLGSRRWLYLGSLQSVLTPINADTI
jgi:hypothetical protein